MKSNCLFTYNDHCIGSNDYLNALRKLGVGVGDTIFVHSDIGTFGKLGPNFSRKELLKGILSALHDGIGEEGTLSMPTYTFSFCRGITFDRQKSPSEVGILTEFFRNESGVSRSAHPIFSIASFGPMTDRLFDIDLDSFGPNSFLANLCDLDAKIIFFGVPFEVACTLVHRVEQAHSVPYRFIKSFQGKVVDGTREGQESCTFFVRPMNNAVENDLRKLGTRLREKGLLVEMIVGAGGIGIARAQDIYREGMSLLDEDINGLIETSFG